MFVGPLVLRWADVAQRRVAPVGIVEPLDGAAGLNVGRAYGAYIARKTRPRRGLILLGEPVLVLSPEAGVVAVRGTLAARTDNRCRSASTRWRAAPGGTIHRVELPHFGIGGHGQCQNGWCSGLSGLCF